MHKRIGVVDVGGGMRGIYAAGVLDYCLDQEICFDLGIGVSAGSANLASFSAGQTRRNLKFYSEYALRKEYMGIGNFLRKHSFIDMDYVYGTLSNSDGESPLDYAAMMKNPMDVLTVATNAVTGEAVYFSKDDIVQNRYDTYKASSSIPFVCYPYEILGTPYYDGALGDPVPIRKAFSMGCDKVVLILTLPQDEIRKPGKDKILAAGIRKKYPLAAEKLEQRAKNYNKNVALAKQYEDMGKLLLIAPDDTCGVSTLTRDADALRLLYCKGYQDAEKISSFIGV